MKRILFLLITSFIFVMGCDNEISKEVDNIQSTEKELENGKLLKEYSLNATDDESIEEEEEDHQEEPVSVEEEQEVVENEEPKEEVKKEEVKEEITTKSEPVKEEPKPASEPVITTKTTTSSESISFDTIEEKDSSLEKGKTKVIQEGQKGVRTITYKETYSNGKLASKKEISSEVTKQPVDKIINVGTKEPQPAASTISIYDLFVNMRTASGLTAERRLQAHNESMEDYETEYYIRQLNSEFNKYIQGNFKWDYRNKNNRSNFLAFRGQSYWYDNASRATPDLYDRIHNKVKEHQLIIEPSFNYSIEDIFIHPERGGYVVSQVLRLKYTSDNGSRIEGMEPNKWYSVRYEVEFSFPGSKPSWTLWNYGDYGWLAAGMEYRIGSFK